MISYADSGNALSAGTRATLDRTIEQLASGEIQPPRTPTGELTELLEPGTGTSFFGGATDVPVTFTLPAGWEVRDIFVGTTGDTPGAGVWFWDVANIYIDPCQWELLDPPVGPTVDDLVTAWSNLPEFNATAPSDVTIDGYEGQRIDLTVPEFNEDDCREGIFGLWKEDGRTDDDPDRWAQDPGQRLELWILDVDGTRLVINASYPPNTSAQHRADLDEIFSSIQIG